MGQHDYRPENEYLVVFLGKDIHTWARPSLGVGGRPGTVTPQRATIGIAIISCKG